MTRTQNWLDAGKDDPEVKRLEREYERADSDEKRREIRRQIQLKRFGHVVEDAQ